MNVKTLRFSVKGDGGHIHVVRAAIAPRTVTLTCSCGDEGPIRMCNHRKALMQHDPSVLAGKNIEDINVLADAAQRTDCARWFDITTTYIRNSADVRAELETATSLYCERTGHRFGPLPDEAEPDADPAEDAADTAPPIVAEPQPKPVRRFYPPPLRAPPIIGRLKAGASKSDATAGPIRVRPFRPQTVRPREDDVPGAVDNPAAVPEPTIVAPQVQLAIQAPLLGAPRRVPYAAMARAAITEAKAAWAKGARHPEAQIPPLLGGIPAEAAADAPAPLPEMFGPPVPGTAASPCEPYGPPLDTFMAQEAAGAEAGGQPAEFFGPPLGAFHPAPNRAEPFGPPVEAFCAQPVQHATPCARDLAAVANAEPPAHAAGAALQKADEPQPGFLHKVNHAGPWTSDAAVAPHARPPCAIEQPLEEDEAMPAFLHIPAPPPALGPQFDPAEMRYAS
ncbi:hypothetical protein RDV64_08185 [Acuticoccus sp. MNP-M23]|uniref:hypothetical protein n=1 Tax=Acuticoccus sp. MNP-M23 TaxID=3072793 RepID=UPI00281672AC|nr:hypothetical protein [Acuticoccus sp. MNP-M23]WMS44356.1 hypothetical protein RDV64_08185 [Acuticoccus sp. MNP-M23]